MRHENIFSLYGISWKMQAGNKLIIEFGYKPGTATNGQNSKTKDERAKNTLCKMILDIKMQFQFQLY